MDLSHPISSVITSGHGPVLEVLSRTNAPLTGRAVGRLLEGRLSRRHVADILRALAASGLVLVEDAGSANLYRLNREHLAASAVVALTELRAAFRDRLTAEIATWSTPPFACWIFGSFASGAGNESSDIDLCVVRSDDVSEDDPVWMDQLESIQAKVSAWTGNDLDILEYGESSFRDLLVHGDLHTQITSKGIRILGPPGSGVDRAA